MAFSNAASSPPLLADLQRVAVIGTSCAGKTTLATRLAVAIGAPHIQLDALYWDAGWRARPLDIFRQATQAAVAGDRWVCDGNYSPVRDLVWGRATAVVWLNYSFPLVFSRALRRTARRVATGERLYSGNRETFRRAFLSRESILWWVITTHGRRRRECPELLASPNWRHLRVHELRHPRAAERLLIDLRSAAAADS